MNSLPQPKIDKLYRAYVHDGMTQSAAAWEAGTDPGTAGRYIRRYHWFPAVAPQRSRPLSGPQGGIVGAKPVSAQTGHVRGVGRKARRRRGGWR